MPVALPVARCLNDLCGVMGGCIDSWNVIYGIISILIRDRASVADLGIGVGVTTRRFDERQQFNVVKWLGHEV